MLRYGTHGIWHAPRTIRPTEERARGPPEYVQPAGGNLPVKVDRMSAQRVSRTPQFKSSYNSGQRQQYRGGGARGGASRGGYSKDTRRSNFRGDSDEDQESPGNATGYYARVGSDEKSEFAGCARVTTEVKDGKGSMKVTEKVTMKESPRACGGYMQNQEGVRTRSMQKALDMAEDDAVEEEAADKLNSSAAFLHASLCPALHGHDFPCDL